MRIACISDTHGFHRKIVVPEADVLVHAGDITMNGEPEVMDDFVGWLHAQPHKHKVLVPGNHDFCLDYQHPRRPKWPGHHMTARDSFDAVGVHFLIGRGVTLDGVKFWGGPWVPNLPLWAFPEGEGKCWKQLPHDVQVLVTHGPVYGIGDRVGPDHQVQVGFGEHVGSTKLGNQLTYSGAIDSLKAHISGHIHESHGVKVVGTRLFVNAAICTRAYNPSNPTVVIDV